MKTLTNKELSRLARRAERAFMKARVLSGCLPGEFGTDLAEDFVDSAMADASAALGDLARIKIQLRLVRQKGGRP